jgi:hypothetical protein
VLHKLREYGGMPPTWSVTAHRKFVWSDWLLLLELDGMKSNAIVRKYTWGLDLAGRSGGASAADEDACPVFPAPGAAEGGRRSEK